MAQTGDVFIGTFNVASLSWGTDRDTRTRTRRTAERYIPIPIDEARRLELYNSNYETGLGHNVYNVRSTDGLFVGELKIAGSRTAGAIEAKQFQGNGNLQILTPWLEWHHARPGDQVRMEWVSPTDIEMTFIRGNGEGNGCPRP